MRLTSKVFWDLAVLMGGFGLLAGVLFPPFVALLGMPADGAFSPLFYGATVAAGLAFDDGRFGLTVSVGGAGMAGEGHDAVTDLIARADGALYDPKAQGRNRLTLVA